MASAQVMSRQDLKAAGKKKLDEFRKKRAAGAKKTTSSTRNNTYDGGSRENQLSDSERVRVIDSEVAGASNAVEAAVSEPSGVVNGRDSTATEASQNSSFRSSNDESANFPPANEFAVNSYVPLNSQSLDKELRGDDASQLNADYNPQNIKGTHGSLASTLSEVAIDQPFALHLSYENIDNTSRQSGYDGLYGTLSSNSNSYLENISVDNAKSSDSLIPIRFPEGSGNVFLPERSGYGDHIVSNHTSSTFGVEKIGAYDSNNSVVSDLRDSMFNSSSAQLSSANNLSPWANDSYYSSFSSSNYGPQTLSSSGTNVRRSRPSFLDSINVSLVPSASPTVPGQKAELFGSKVHPEDSLGSYPAHNSANSSVSLGNGTDMFKQVMDNRQEFYPRKQDEDFAALEQHIEDLTQEKFSLQRALDASRALAESLASENSALTDNYNQQGGVMNQLKSDMENLQAEIRANLVELESVRIEYANAQLECNAADERARLLASEVIGLEEKALRLRSNELKLERQLEESQAEISSFKKRMSSLEKDRQDLQSTIAALQEEKKLLQSKLRKASGNGKAVEVSKSPTNKKDVSTSTEDLVENHDVDTSTGTSNMEGNSGNDSSNLPFLHDNRDFNLQDLSLAIPPDQMRMIENINTLMSELSLEKEELVQALFAESSQSSKLKDLNKDLTRKLEVQTQRLELLTAQSMVNDIIPARQPDTHTVSDNTPYADEGDEVVERVLGWIMKLFPGGPSRRRTSKLL